MQRRKVELCGCEDLFEAIVVSGEHGIHKPDPAIFQIACDKMGVSPEEVIKKINNISKDSIAEIIDRVLDTNTLCVAAVGAIDSVDNLLRF